MDIIVMKQLKNTHFLTTKITKLYFIYHFCNKTFMTYLGIQPISSKHIQLQDITNHNYLTKNIHTLTDITTQHLCTTRFSLSIIKVANYCLSLVNLVLHQASCFLLMQLLENLFTKFMNTIKANKPKYAKPTTILIPLLSHFQFFRITICL